jgi:phosphate:Na+ symporter
MEKLNYFLLFGSLGQFLFGMLYLEESIKQIGSKKVKKYLKENTSTPLRSIFSGTFVTAILQSSSLVSLMTLAFVGAGILKLTNAVGIIIGANLGTTITGWFFALLGFKFNINNFTLLIMGFGGIIITVANHKNKLTAWARFGLGFALLFIGLEGMKESISEFAGHIDINVYRDYGLISFFGIGFVITAIIQSSSASMVLALSALNSGILQFDQAVAYVIGSDLGTTITVFFGVIKGGANKKRVALSHFLFNFINNTLGIILIIPLIAFVQKVLGIQNNLLALVACHTSLNIFGIILFYPFIPTFSNFLTNLFSKEKEDADSLELLNLFPSPTTGVPEYLSSKAQEFLNQVFLISTDVLNPDSEIHRKQLIEKYDQLKQIEGLYSKKIVKSMLHEHDTKDIVLLQNILEVFRQGTASLKALKDVVYDLKEIWRSDPQYFSLVNQYIQKQNRVFSRNFIDQAIDQEIRSLTEEKLKQLLKELSHDVYQHLANGDFNEQEASTLLNILTEVARSNYEYLEALNILDESVRSMSN